MYPAPLPTPMPRFEEKYYSLCLLWPIGDVSRKTTDCVVQTIWSMSSAYVDDCAGVRLVVVWQIGLHNRCRTMESENPPLLRHRSLLTIKQDWHREYIEKVSVSVHLLPAFHHQSEKRCLFAVIDAPAEPGTRFFELKRPGQGTVWVMDARSGRRAHNLVFNILGCE